eukprot:s365_g9.t1
MNAPQPDADVNAIHKGISKVLRQVGTAFEKAYDNTVSMFNMQSGHNSCPVRNVTSKPRLHKRTVQKTAAKMSPCQARQGEYEPPCEVFWVRNLQMVKQVRRLEALVRRMSKKQDPCAAHVHCQNLREWNTICYAKGFQPSFQKWALSLKLIDVWYACDLPPVEWLKTLLDALRVCADWSAKKEQRVRSAQFQHHVDLSLLHFGGTLAHALIKPPRCEEPHCFEIDVCAEATLMRNHGKQKPSICIKEPDKLRFHEPILINNKPCNIVHCHPDGKFEIDHMPATASSNFQVWQKQISSDPEAITKAFFEFWAPYWLRDNEHELTDITAWSDFLNLLEQIPNLSTPDLSGDHSLQEWKTAIKMTKTETARGVCALSQPELQYMHDDLLSRIIAACNLAKHAGLPPWLMLAKVFLVPKNNEAKSFDQMRPITVFALVFRIWTKVAARRLLLQWKNILPKNVVGAIPGRSSTTLTLENGLQIEKYLRLGTDAGGFNLDISKCFNRFGRLPISVLLKRNGFDEVSCAFWFNSLHGMSRTAFVLGCASEPSKATTGLAEGDPLSVCGMILVGYGWHALISKTGAITAVFADDWSWMAEGARIHIAAMQMTHRYLDALKLVSDPAKCWCWGTSKTARKAWHEICTAVVGAPKHFNITLAERELGVFMHYSKITHLGCQKKRVEVATAKLQRLSKLTISIPDKAKLIQSSVWPSAFFGVEGVYVGQKHFSTLRSQATGVLTTKTKATSTLLCLSACHKFVMDPFFFALLRVLLTWRRLMLLDPDNCECFQHILIAATDDPNKAYGPAAALKCYMDNVGWTISDNGFFLDHYQQEFQLQKVTTQWLVKRLWSAWDRVVTQSINKRNGMQDWPEIGLEHTRQIALPCDQRDAAVLLIQRSLGTLFATQRDHWGNEEYPEHTTCPLCDGPDDRSHFPMQCEALADLRDEFAVMASMHRLLRFALEQDPGRAETPREGLILFLVRLAIRVESYGRLVVEQRHRVGRRQVDAKQTNLDRIRKGLDDLSRVLHQDILQMLLEWATQAVRRRPRSMATICRIHAHIAFLFKNHVPESKEDIAIFLSSQIFIINNATAGVGESSTTKSASLGVGEFELFDLFEMRRYGLAKWLREHRKEASVIMENVEQVVTCQGVAFIDIPTARSWSELPHEPGNWTLSHELENSRPPAWASYREWLQLYDSSSVVVSINQGRYHCRDAGLGLLPRDVLTSAHLTEAFGSLTDSQVVVREETAHRRCFELVGQKYEVHVWDEDPRLENGPLNVNSLEKVTGGWWMEVLEPILSRWRLKDLTFYKISEGSSSADLWLLAVAPNLQLEIGVWRQTPLVEIYDLPSHGRQIYRRLIFTSDMTWSLHSPEGPEAALYSVQTAGWSLGKGTLPSENSKPEQSVRVFRYLSSAQGREEFVPAEMLRGLLPDALLERYKFWRHKGESETLLAEERYEVDQPTRLRVKFLSPQLGLFPEALTTVKRCKLRRLDPTSPRSNGGWEEGAADFLVNTKLGMNGLTELLARLENLSHILAWSDRVDGKGGVYRIELPRLSLSFTRSDGDGGGRFYCDQLAGHWILENPESTSVPVHKLLAHFGGGSVLLGTGDGNLAILVSALAQPLRPWALRGASSAAGSGPAEEFLPGQLLLRRASGAWVERLREGSRYYCYPLHRCSMMVFTPTPAAALYLLLCRYLTWHFEEVVAMAGAICEVVRPEEQQLWECSASLAHQEGRDTSRERHHKERSSRGRDRREVTAKSVPPERPGERAEEGTPESAEADEPYFEGDWDWAPQGKGDQFKGKKGKFKGFKGKGKGKYYPFDPWAFQDFWWTPPPPQKKKNRGLKRIDWWAERGGKGKGKTPPKSAAAPKAGEPAAPEAAPPTTTPTGEAGEGGAPAASAVAANPPAESGREESERAVAERERSWADASD